MKKDQHDDVLCKYNCGVVCSEQTRCERCGFYRPVHKKRVARIRSNLTGKIKAKKEEQPRRVIRPIDANALLEKQYNASRSNEPDLAEMVVCVRDIEDAPTVDAASMVHAWTLMRSK